jgi:Family of unknown function (DUF6510)
MPQPVWSRWNTTQHVSRPNDSDRQEKLDGEQTRWQRCRGILHEIFPFDMTLVQATCTGCGATDAVGALAAYMHGMGAVLRCPSCNTVLIRMAQIKGRYWLDMRGVRVLQISVDP